MGLVAIETVLVSAASYNLTDLATCKDELQIPTGDTSQDTFLTRALAQCSIAIRNHCNRTFQTETVRNDVYPERDAYPYQVPGGVFPLQVTRWPITTLPIVTLATSADVSSGDVLTFADTTGVVVGVPVFMTPATTGQTPPPGLANDMVVSAVTATTVTLSANVTADIASGSSVSFGTRVVINDPPGSPTEMLFGTDYIINVVNGQLVRLNPYTGYPSTWDASQAIAWFAGGYSTIPDDVVDATLRLVTARFKNRGRDPYLRSRDQPGLGREEYWVGGLPTERGMLTEEIADLLDNYRVPVTA